MRAAGREGRLTKCSLRRAPRRRQEHRAEDGGWPDNKRLPIHLRSPWFPSPHCLVLSVPYVRRPRSFSPGLSVGPVYPGPLQQTDLVQHGWSARPSGPASGQDASALTPGHAPCSPLHPWAPLATSLSQEETAPCAEPEHTHLGTSDAAHRARWLSAPGWPLSCPTPWPPYRRGNVPSNSITQYKLTVQEWVGACSGLCHDTATVQCQKL